MEDQYRPAFIQPQIQPNSAVPLSPFAPAFNPRVPPPNMIPAQGHPNQNQSHPNFPPPFTHANIPLVNEYDMVEPHRFEHVPYDSSQQFVPTQQNQGQRGRYHNQNSYRGGRGNWHHGDNRSRSRGGLNHFHNQNIRRGNYNHQFVSNPNRRGRHHQTHANERHNNERHSRNDYGDLLYSHADMSNTGNMNPRNSGDDPSQLHTDQRNGESRSAESGNQRHFYVRKVDQHRGRENVEFRSAHAGHSTNARGGREDYRKEERPLDPQRGSSGTDQDNRNGAQSAAPRRKKSAGNKSEAFGRSETEEKDRRVQMEEQLKRGRYECMVCCDNIRQEVAVWNCQKCYHVFHLRCIKQWVKSSLEAEEDIWRCPACQNSNDRRPNGYRCFCGKVKDPKFQPGETPHSCGEVCGRKGKEGCTHKCVLLCHPGPCPPCNAVIQRTCDCGAEKKMMRCGQTAMIKCEKVCGKELNCGQHHCQVVCHKEDCPPCQVTLQQECYGGHKKRDVLCGSEEAVMLSYSCQQPCSKNLKCGNHVCEDLCHPGECGDCPLTPEKTTHCCCGQTRITDLDAPSRTSCLDPVPTCDKTCNRPMSCGPADSPHICQQKCHDGPCGQCEGVTTLTCVCGANQKEFPCRELDRFSAEEPFKCERRCNKKRLCGRHKCNELCCTRDVHICEIVCGRPLSCGLHKCEELCHRGNCRSCLQASFEELPCRCGAEVIYPPVPCGAKPPACHKICTRQHTCDHPVRHTCHSEDTCPPCTELVQKMCMGDHELRKNVPCYMLDISCGRPCGKPLPCGQHKCIKTCHKGVCLLEQQNEVCSQPCTKKRRECPHPCAAPCHPDTDACPQTSCKAQMEIKCACGHRTAKVQCQAGSNMSAEIAQFQRMTVQAMASGGPGQDIDISQLTTQKKNTARQLECDSTCAILERNRRVALALEIQNPDLEAKLNGPKYSDFLKESARKYPAFVSKVEKNFADLVQNAKMSKQPSRSFAFPSMNRDQRRVVHELAESYGCETQSYDYEPNKNVVATAYKNRCFTPSVTLMASISRTKAPPPIPHHARPAAAWGTDKLVTSLFKEKEKGKEKTDIDYFDFSSN